MEVRSFSGLILIRIKSNYRKKLSELVTCYPLKFRETKSEVNEGKIADSDYVVEDVVVCLSSIMTSKSFEELALLY